MDGFGVDTLKTIVELSEFSFPARDFLHRTAYTRHTAPV